jgi:TP901 family phage tail tape measure protein
MSNYKIKGQFDIKDILDKLKRLGIKAKDAFGDYKTAVKKTNAELNKTQKATQGIGNAFTKLKGKISSAFSSNIASITATLGATALLAQGIRKTITSYKDLDTGLRNVNSIIGVSKEELNGYKDSILDMQATTGATTKELTEGFYQLVSAGVEAKDSMATLEVATRAGIAGLSDTSTAVDGLTTVMNAWKIESDDAERVADIMFQTVKLGKTTFGEIASAISQVAPLSASMGVSFDEISAALATLTKQGTPTGMAITQIRGALIAMNSKLGDGWSNIYTFNEAAQEMVKRAKGSQNELKNMVGRIEGVNGILGVTGANAKMAASDFDSMRGSFGAMNKAFIEQSESIEFKINKLDGAMISLSSTLVDTFAESLTTLIDNFTGGLEILTGKAEQARRRILAQTVTNKDVEEAFIKGYETPEGLSEDERTAYLKNELDTVTKQWDELYKKLTETRKKYARGLETKGREKGLADLEVAMLRLETQAEALNAELNKTTIEPPGGNKKIIDSEIVSIDSLTQKIKDLNEQRRPVDSKSTLFFQLTKQIKEAEAALKSIKNIDVSGFIKPDVSAKGVQLHEMKSTDYEMKPLKTIYPNKDAEEFKITIDDLTDSQLYLNDAAQMAGDTLARGLTESILLGRNLGQVFQQIGLQLGQMAMQMLMMAGLKALFTSIGIPFLAEGGVVTKPTLAMVGEKESEAVIPLSKLDSALNKNVVPLSRISNHTNQAQRIEIGGEFSIRGTTLKAMAKRMDRIERKYMGNSK